MMRFRLLGPLEVRDGDGWRGIGAPKWRSLLAALLINAGQIVSTDALIDEIWGDEPPAKAANLVSIYVLRLRRLIEEDGSDGSVLVTRAPGYQLLADKAQTDVQQFEAMVRDGRRALAAKEPEQAAGHLAAALALWRGSVLADVPRTGLVEAEAERLARLKLDAAELRVTAELACGGHAQVVHDLRRLLADNPLREGLWLLLMQALDGSGRHAEALESYGQARAVIAEELGVDPGPELRRLYARLLAEDSSDTPDSGPAGIISAGTVPASTSQPAAASTQASTQPSPQSSTRLPPAARAPGAQPPAGQQSTDPQPTAAQQQQFADQQAGTQTQCPAQLPADVADFTGREDQVTHLCTVLAAASAINDGAVRIALVAGYGGLGKTSLAVHAAHKVRSEFPDGQLYVDLLGATAHPLVPADVLARFLRDLGVDGREVPLDEAERAARYRTRLAGRRILVVLDNARDAAQVRSLLPGSSSCAVLITTRNRMPDLASTKLVDLNVLDDDEALSLFTKVVGDERPVAEPEATADVLLACAGLPLAIRICAARLVTRSGWTIGTMADRLRDEHRRLDEMTAGDLAVRASFEVSFASLPAAARRGADPALAFRLLGLWQGPTISSAAAAALFDTTEDRATDVLEILVDAHLLESKTPDRYKFHDLLRVYSSERAVSDLPSDDRQSAVKRLLAWYMRTADTAATRVSPYRYDIPLEPAADAPSALAFATSKDALDWYDSERVNIVIGTRQAAACGLHDIAWRLPAPLLNIFDSRGNWSDCITSHRIALDSARQAGNRQGEAWVLNTLGEALGRTSDNEGISYIEQAIAIRREIGDRRGEAQAANNLADVYTRLGRLDEALELLRRGLERNRQVGFRYGEGIALVNLGDVLLGLKRADDAINCLEQARSVFEDIDDADGTGYALHWLGRCHVFLGRDVEALDCFQRGLASHQAAGNRHRQAITLRQIGGTQARLGRTGDARASWTQAASIYDELSDTAQAVRVRAELADIS
jgi:DNA-binding SARP family transcriptional activator/predicted negative regulator of RcsB-dependent stress response